MGAKVDQRMEFYFVLEMETKLVDTEKRNKKSVVEVKITKREVVLIVDFGSTTELRSQEKRNTV